MNKVIAHTSQTTQVQSINLNEIASELYKKALRIEISFQSAIHNLSESGKNLAKQSELNQHYNEIIITVKRTRLEVLDNYLELTKILLSHHDEKNLKTTQEKVNSKDLNHQLIFEQLDLSEKISETLLKLSLKSNNNISNGKFKENKKEKFTVKPLDLIHPWWEGNTNELYH